jgi:hypothetical protein
MIPNSTIIILNLIGAMTQPDYLPGSGSRGMHLDNGLQKTNGNCEK